MRHGGQVLPPLDLGAAPPPVLHDEAGDETGLDGDHREHRQNQPPVIAPEILLAEENRAVRGQRALGDRPSTELAGVERQRRVALPRGGGPRRGGAGGSAQPPPPPPPHSRRSGSPGAGLPPPRIRGRDGPSGRTACSPRPTGARRPPSASTFVRWRRSPEPG